MMDEGSKRIISFWLVGSLALGGLFGLLMVIDHVDAYTVRDIIKIEGDGDFNVTNGVSGGVGTKLDPYIIDGWEIDGGGEGRCIYVGNTTKHFVIRNCNLTNASGNGNQFYKNAGVSLYNATNVTIENCVFAGNGHGIYLDTSSGFTIIGNQFDNNDYGIYLYIVESGLDRDYTILDMVIKNNEFDMTTNNNVVFFDIILDYNGNGQHDVNIGNVIISDNEFTMNGTTAKGIYIDNIDVFDLVDGNINMGDVNISGNRIFGGSRAIDFYGYFYYYTNVTLNVGNVTVNGNLLLNQSSDCIYINYYDVEDMYGNTKATLGDLIINENRMISGQNTVNGIFINDYAYWAYFEDDTCLTVGDLFVENNVIDVDGYGAYVYYSYAAFDLRDESSVTMGNASIRNNTIFNSSYGIYLKYSYTAGVMIDNASAIFGDTAIIDNLINSTSDAIFFDYYHISYDMNDNAIAVFGGLFISDNRLDTMSKGIYFDNSEYRGYEMEKSSSFLLGEIFITRNQIDSRNSAIYLDYRYFGYAMYNDASMSTGDITIFDNQLTSDVSETIYFYLDDSAKDLYKDSTVIMGNISVIDNTLTSSSDDGLYVEYSCGGVGASMEGNAYAKLPGYFITGNTFDVDREGIYFDLYYVAEDNRDNASVDMGEILIDNNTFADCTHGVDISIYEIASGYNSTTATVGEIVISNNEFLNITNDAIYIYFDEFGYHFRDNEVLTLGEIWIVDNLIEGCDDGIHVEYDGLFSGSFANVTIGGLHVLDNDISDCSNYGIYAYYNLDADDYSTLTVGNATISGNMIFNCSNEGIYLNNYINKEQLTTVILGSALIIDNEILNCTGSSSGIYLNDVQHATISDNVISKCYNGIHLYISHNTSILRNIARENRNAGLFIKNSHDNTVNLTSLTLNKYGALIDPSRNTNIHNSSIHNNTDHGINATDNDGLAVDASRNWWGSDTGPFHISNNSGGKGDNVTNYTGIANWLSAPILFITSDPETMTLEDELFTIDYEALDVDGNPLNWSLNTSAQWLSMDPDTGVLSGTPGNDDVGDYTVNISVIDDFGGEDQTDFILSVLNVNDAPNITTADLTAILEDALYYVDYNATDIDPTEDILNWSMEANVTWLSINSSSGLLQGTPTNSDVGEHQLNVTVSDGMGGTAWHNFILTVENVNDVPIITTGEILNATQDEFYNAHFEAGDSDPTNDTLSWDLDSNATWLSMNSTSRNLSGTPSNADVGEEWVNLSCKDNNNGTGWYNFTLTVKNVNDAPDITTKDNLTANEDQLYSVDYEAVDIDPTVDVLFWSVETNATWLSINSSSGLLSGIPAVEDVGKYWVKVSVTDGNDADDSHNFTLSVINVNDAPMVTSLTFPDATEGEAYLFGLQYSDEEGDSVTWEISTNADWLTIDDKTGVLSGTPPMGSKGEYWVNISLTDINGKTAFYNFSFLVIEGNADRIPIGEIDILDGEVRYLKYTDPWSGTFLDLKVAGNGTLVAARIENNSGDVGGDPDGYARISFYLELTFTGELNWTNISISFADIVLNESLDYSDAIIFYFNGITWKEAENTGVDMDKKIVWANVTHFTIFAAFAPIKSEDSKDVDDGEGEWYNSSVVIISGVVILLIIVLVIIFVVVKASKGGKYHEKIDESGEVTEEEEKKNFELDMDEEAKEPDEVVEESEEAESKEEIEEEGDEIIELDDETIDEVSGEDEDLAELVPDTDEEVETDAVVSEEAKTDTTVGEESETEEEEAAESIDTEMIETSPIDSADARAVEERKSDAEAPALVDKTAQKEEKIAAQKQKEMDELAEELAEFDEQEDFEED